MDSENHIGADGASDMAHPGGPGAQLRAAREAMRVDLAHIAAETRIPLRHLEAIEDDNYEILPSRAYAIGFSRTFAQAVGLDPAAITDAVRAELADGSMRRAVPSPEIEPGDPARLPSAGLAWAMGGAVLVLAIGTYTFYDTFFGVGAQPAAVETPAPAPTAAPAPAASASAPAATGPVVLTAMDEGVWVRLYEEGGARLVERTLALGETVTVPDTATDPRLNTGRPDALAITVGGQEIARLSERPLTMSSVPVSAAALLARANAPAGAASGTPAQGQSAAEPAR